MDKASTAALNTIRKKMVDIVTKLSQQNKYSLVLEKVTTIYSQNNLDITKKVIDELNSQLPKVPVNFNTK